MMFFLSSDECTNKLGTAATEWRMGKAVGPSAQPRRAASHSPDSDTSHTSARFLPVSIHVPHCACGLENSYSWGAWAAQLAKHLTLAQVMIPVTWDWTLHGPPCPPHSCSISHSFIHTYINKTLKLLFSRALLMPCKAEPRCMTCGRGMTCPFWWLSSVFLSGYFSLITFISNHIYSPLSRVFHIQKLHLNLVISFVTFWALQPELVNILTFILSKCGL